MEPSVLTVFKGCTRLLVTVVAECLEEPIAEYLQFALLFAPELLGVFDKMLKTFGLGSFHSG